MASVISRGHTGKVARGSRSSSFPPPAPVVSDLGTVTISATRMVNGVARGTAPIGLNFLVDIQGAVSDIPDFDWWSDYHFTWHWDDPGHYTRHDSNDLPWGRVFDDGGVIKIVEGPEVRDQNRNLLPETAILGPDGFEPASGTAVFLGNDKNIAWGPCANHVFAPTAADFAGAATKTYNPQLEIRTSPTEEPVMTIPFQVIVDNPEVIFAGARTVCLTSDGLPTGEEPQGALMASNLVEARDKLVATGHTVRRYLIARGHEIALDGVNLSHNGTIGKLHLGSYGSSPDPAILRALLSGITLSGSGSDRESAVYGLDVLGPFDASNPYSVTQNPPDGITAIPSGVAGEGGGAWTSWDMLVKGFQTCFKSKDNSTKRGIVIGNTRVTDYQAYGCYWNPGYGRSGAAGFFGRQDPYAVCGEVDPAYQTGPAYYTTYGAWRSAGYDAPLAFNLIDMGNIGDDTGGMYQPALRLAGNGTEVNLPFREEAVVDRMRAEGGNPFIQGVGATAETTDKKYSGPAVSRRIIYDKAYVLLVKASAGTGGFGYQITGPTMRNVVMLFADGDMQSAAAFDYPNSTQKGSVQFGKFDYRDGAYVYSTDLFNHKTRFYNNTFVSDRLDEVVDHWVMDTDPALPFVTSVKFWNNLMVMLKGKTGAGTVVVNNNDTVLIGTGGGDAIYVAGEGGAPPPEEYFDLTPLFTPFNKGFLWLAEYDAGIRHADKNQTPPLDSAKLMMPKAGSPYAGTALTTGGARVAVDDFFGRLRNPTAPSKGAIEPA